MGYGYRYGWYINKSKYHQVFDIGGISGFTSELDRNLYSKSVVIMLSNNETNTSSIVDYINDKLNVKQ